MKTYQDFLLEQSEINFLTFQQLSDGQFVRLFNNGKDLGPFRIDKAYSTNPEIKGIDTITVQKLNDDGTFDPAHGNFTIKFDDMDYTFQPMGTRYSSGIIFEYKGKILLVHPTGTPITKSFTYPKGTSEPGEKPEDTAYREVREETGIDYPKELLKEKPLKSLQYFKKDALKIQYFYIVNLTSEEYKRYIGVNIIPKENLQLDEISWAGFVKLDECEKLLKNKFEVILNYFKKDI